MLGLNTDAAVLALPDSMFCMLGMLKVLNARQRPIYMCTGRFSI